MVNHGSAMVVYRTSCCPILFVIILLINKSDSCYQLIKTMTKFGKETRHQLYVFIKKTTTTEATTHTHFCPLPQALHDNCPFNCRITLSNYKHGAYTVLLMLKSGW